MNYRKALGTSIIMMIVGMSPIVLSVIITVAANTTDLETYTVTFAYLIGVPVGVILNVTSSNGIRPNRAVNLIFGFCNKLGNIL